VTCRSLPPACALSPSPPLAPLLSPQSRLTTLMQQCDDLSYTQQLQRQEFESDRMRAQDRASQVPPPLPPSLLLTPLSFSCRRS
jgi:hypothetical protein